ncbi:iron complex transport system ATP-binding protein [Methanomicrobium sp. W14]|uniref:ABC transporter ATP-binding protein n=1 Tax=Methanomicrobium sp. W14 TaxID=2817839 RepID=UPI001AE7D9C5|nr:ABC transporter ATP-binding protein [Methanomicrobium sp. W14]MBP2134384.1 iron complex transport system ATP-binding protein [Methanomicrobium sp. W14]
MPEGPAVSAEDLSFSYGEKPVFSGISLEAEPGEVLGLVGPNGSGKTTLIKCMDGILSPKGKVEVFGKDVGSLDRTEIAKRIAYVPQSLPEGLSSYVYETVLMGRRPHLNWNVRPEDEEKVFSAMKLLGVEDFAFRKTGELSGGERQRVMIARAVVQETPVILMDEPTSSLDVRHQMEVMETMKSLAKERSTAVIVSLHDLNLAAGYCDRIAMLKDGKVFCSGRPEEVLKKETIKDVYGIETCIKRINDRVCIIPLKPAEIFQEV